MKTQKKNKQNASTMVIFQASDSLKDVKFTKPVKMKNQSQKKTKKNK